MQLEGDALEKACEHWLMYVETYDEIDEIFTKYAARDTDQLSIRELGMVSFRPCAHCTQQQYRESVETPNPSKRRNAEMSLYISASSNTQSRGGSWRFLTLSYRELLERGAYQGVCLFMSVALCSLSSFSTISGCTFALQTSYCGVIFTLLYNLCVAVRLMSVALCSLRFC